WLQGGHHFARVPIVRPDAMVHPKRRSEHGGGECPSAPIRRISTHDHPMQSAVRALARAEKDHIADAVSHQQQTEHDAKPFKPPAARLITCLAVVVVFLSHPRILTGRAGGGKREWKGPGRLTHV